jgi:hypothetical protein
MNTKMAEDIEKSEIKTPPIAGPVDKIVVPTINPSKVKTKENNFFTFVVEDLLVGIFRINQPIGAPRTEIKIMIVTTRAKDSMGRV